MKILAALFIALSVSPRTHAADITPISARSPEILATYKQAPKFLKAVRKLPISLRAQCESLLASQLRLQKETDSWKMYSLYEMLTEQKLMTGELVRVPTVTQLSESLPRYTNFKISNELENGAIIVADLGPQCGPDPLSPRKGAYFLKCGDFLIGSGLIRADRLDLAKCANVRVLALPGTR